MSSLAYWTCIYLIWSTQGEGGHGLSIGSLGENGQVVNVSNILFENAVMVNELYAARF